MTATASSTASGSVKIENLSTGQTVTQSFSGESDVLCETNAEFIIEAFEEGGQQVNLADFTTVTFTDVSVSTAGGTGDGYR